jgi:NTP pyrophosphatase (non-canonical NTP hydrolase)
MLNELAKSIHNVNVEKGFWDKDRNLGELLMLVTSELAEALEADREGRWYVTPGNEVQRSMNRAFDVDKLRKEGFSTKPERLSFEAHMKDTFEDEIADAIIRLLDLCAGFGIDIDLHLNAKMAYNTTRERLHGKKY